MLFEIHKSCLKLLKNNDSDVCTMLNSIALSRRKGINLIVAEREVLNELSKSELLEKNTRHVFSVLFRRSAEMRALKKKVSRYYTIISDEGIECSNQYTITIGELLNTEFINKSKFIVENLDDFYFYRNLGQYYSWKNRINCEISLDKSPGGGHPCAELFDDLINENNNLLFGIFDGDQKYPSDNKGETIKAIESKVGNKSKRFFDFISLADFDAHEVENLIPIFIIEKIYDSRETYSQNTIKFLKEFLLLKHPQLYFYFDMKKGIYNPKKHYTEQYDMCWKTILEEFCKTYSLDMKYIHGVTLSGTDLLKGVKEYLENHETRDDIFKLVSESQNFDSKWTDIGKEIFTWGCVGKKIS